MRPIPHPGATASVEHDSPLQRTRCSTLRPRRYRRFSQAWGWDLHQADQRQVALPLGHGRALLRPGKRADVDGPGDLAQGPRQLDHPLPSTSWSRSGAARPRPPRHPRPDEGRGVPQHPQDRARGGDHPPRVLDPRRAPGHRSARGCCSSRRQSLPSGRIRPRSIDGPRGPRVRRDPSRGHADRRMPDRGEPWPGIIWYSPPRKESIWRIA